MAKLLDKFIKKHDVIHDGGVEQKGNHVDFFVVLLCILVSAGLIYLGVMAFITA